MASHFIASSSSLLNDARRPLFTQDTHCALFNPVPVLLECLSIPREGEGAATCHFV